MKASEVYLKAAKAMAARQHCGTNEKCGFPCCAMSTAVPSHNQLWQAVRREFVDCFYDGEWPSTATEEQQDVATLALLFMSEITKDSERKCRR